MAHPDSLAPLTGLQGLPYEACKVTMHSKLLCLRPRLWEQHYFAQLEGLDLLNCLITPLFFASTLSRWPRSFLSSVYCMVLAIKGYQMALLLLPAARKYRAHAKSRYWIILAERILRQFVATPALGRGERFVQWMRDATVADPGPVTAIKLAMLVSGVTHAFWNAFCLPLDIVSQVVLNSAFFCMHVGAVLCQVAYAVGMLVRHKQRLVWLQWGLEHLATRILQPLQLLLRSAAAALSSLTGSNNSSSSMQSVLQLQPEQCVQDAFAQVSQPPGRAPDLETPAGRLVLALTMGLMLLTVLYLPLVFAWRLERHLKARFMVAVMQKAGSDGSSPCSSPIAKAAGCSSAGAFACTAGKAHTSSYWEDEFTKGGSKGTGKAAFISPPASFPLLPTMKGAVIRHVGAAGVVCFLLGEVFVWLCTVSPLVKSIIWEQVPGHPQSS